MEQKKLGRPYLPDELKKVKAAFTISPRVYNYLRSKPNRSEIVDRAVRMFMELDNSGETAGNDI